MDGRVMRHSVIGSCQSHATFKIVKELLVTSLTHVSNTIASILPLSLQAPIASH